MKAMYIALLLPVLIGANSEIVHPSTHPHPAQHNGVLHKEHTVQHHPSFLRTEIPHSGVSTSEAINHEHGNGGSFVHGQMVHKIDQIEPHSINSDFENMDQTRRSPNNHDNTEIHSDDHSGNDHWNQNDDSQRPLYEGETHVSLTEDMELQGPHTIDNGMQDPHSEHEIVHDDERQIDGETPHDQEGDHPLNENEDKEATEENSGDDGEHGHGHKKPRNYSVNGDSNDLTAAMMAANMNGASYGGMDGGYGDYGGMDGGYGGMDGGYGDYGGMNGGYGGGGFGDMEGGGGYGDDMGRNGNNDVDEMDSNGKGGADGDGSVDDDDMDGGKHRHKIGDSDESNDIDEDEPNEKSSGESEPAKKKETEKSEPAVEKDTDKPDDAGKAEGDKTSVDDGDADDEAEDDDDVGADVDDDAEPSESMDAEGNGEVNDKKRLIDEQDEEEPKPPAKKSKPNKGEQHSLTKKRKHASDDEETDSNTEEKRPVKSMMNPAGPVEEE